jgi:hypothetical protein
MSAQSATNPPTQSFNNNTNSELTATAKHSVSFAPLLPPVTNTPLPPAIKKAQFFVQLVKSFSAHIPPSPLAIPPMPIAVDNGLPHLTFDLGAMLFVTCPFVA